MASDDRLRFGVDLVTFFHPGFWGVDSHDAIVGRARAAPRAFWDKILDSVQASGVTGVELTFSPFNWQDAIKTYGSIDGFAAELARRGLTLCSGFFAELEAAGDFTAPEAQRALIDKAERYADFLKACGSDIMVIGAPLRQTLGAQPVQFHDFDRAKAIADFLNRLGATLHARGVRLALHTEAHSIFAAARDVDLMMLLTDPAYVHMCPDTAHIIVAGSDPVQLVDRHHERMIIAHWKDAVGPMPADTPIDKQIHERHQPYFCGFGLGRVDWPAWIRLLRDKAYEGWAILELDAAPDPVRDIANGLTLVRQALLPIYR
ncbi:putative myo-inositol catabolism protein (plasmid) [Rhizobium etli CFN 42]|uniref:Myo-inositol catabolism protein n=1 Tax=Rhizobium etli (strain ATCC 51251 / DSM 11541 / JCM 21823 / NBRC 15573 / CFN 42) TaxID=347834 RepID=Q2K1P3_RHIEC|nr:sugar phosphate isomerase/epimerase [Rhizobium etli]ABC93403.1 putative myo-inositol catabolism protein [Rhizobium etli CFN 42]